MLGTRLRNGKQRMFLLLPTGIALLLGIYILRDMHMKLQDSRGKADKCQQREESLSAQLQVVYEHKSRLEKSLLLEKTQHKKTKDDLQSQYQELQDNKEKEKLEAVNRFNSLQQQHKMLQIQTEDLQEDLNKVRQSNTDLLKEKQQLQSNFDSEIDLNKQKENDMHSLKEQIKQLQNDIQILNKQISDRDQQISELDNQTKACQERLIANHSSKKSEILIIPNPGNVPNADIKHMPNAENLKLLNSKTNSDVALEDVKEAGEKKVVERSENELIPPIQNLKIGQHVKDVEKMKPSNPDLQKKLFDIQDPPIPEQHPVPVPENGRNLNQKVDDEDGEAAVRLPIGLEQQENGEDQDLDNIEEEEEGAAAAVEQKQMKKPREFEDKDFDQVEDGNFVKQHEGIMVAPH